MKLISIIVLLAFNSLSLLAQTVLTIEGQVVNSSVTGLWNGVVIPRNQPTTLTYRNNSITAVNTSGYMLQAGDETPLSTNNNLDGEIITGNKLIWNGINTSSIITHGLFTGYNINIIVKYNYLENVPYGIIFKSGTDDGDNMTFTSGGCAYNICKNGKFGGRVKGINGLKFYNNTFYSGDGNGQYLLGLTINLDRTITSASTGTKVFNNIFYSTTQIPMILVDAGCQTDFESDYNIFWCSSGAPVFKIDGVTKSWAQWQALGYDKHSLVVNPNFKDFINFVPTVRLDYGIDLGTTWQKGLSVDGVWGSSDPETVNQNGTWQVGARIYSSQVVPAESISITGAGGATSITNDNGTLLLSASVLPANATNRDVVWSVTNGSGQATISPTGLVTAVDNGNVTARATAKDGSGVYGTFNIAISNQVVPVNSIVVTGAGGATTIASDNGSLLLSALVLPSNATNKIVTWSIVNGSSFATINSSGLVEAIDNGIITARATATDGSNVSGNLVITITKQVIPVTDITVTGAGDATTITTDGGSLQLSESVLPANATDKSVSWSIINGTGKATVNSTGLLTAIENGTVTVLATAADGSGVIGSLEITISNQLIKVKGITVTGADGITSITTDNGSIQLNAEVLPAEATDKIVIWSIVNGAGQASVNSEGVVSAIDNGTVTVTAIAHDGSGVYGTIVITVSNQIVPVTGITVKGAAGLTSITTNNGVLQLNADVLPLNATNKTVIWSLVNGTGQGTINSTGLVTASDNGTVTAIATAIDGSLVSGSLIINISNQIISVIGITITGAGDATTITNDDGSLQLSAVVTPVNATNKSIIWSLANGTGQATINTSGIVTAIDNGTVTVKATAVDGSEVFGIIVITISNQIIPVNSIIVSGSGGASIITTENGTLQLNASLLPLNATNKSVIWSIINGTGEASISSSGLVTAISNGRVTAVATANDGSGVYGNLKITISTDMIPVSGITITAPGGISEIIEDKGSLQLTAVILPADPTDNTVEWSLSNGTGQATIDATGLVTAIANGTVTARATANDGSGVYNTLIITISNQIIKVSGISIAGEGGATTISTDDGNLRLYETVFPADASNKTVTWGIVNGTGQATVNTSGIVTALDNGTVTATATANDGSSVNGSLVITISNQIVPVTGITITGAGGLTSITVDKGSLQLTANVLPANCSDKTVSWSILNITGQAVISPGGLITAIKNGIVTAKATANDGTSVGGTLNITISNQIVLVTGISVTGTGGINSISSDNGSLQLIETVLPADATNKTVTWSIINGTTLATISSAGFLTATDNGTVTVRATANDGSGVYGTMVLTLSNQIVPVTTITVTGTNGSNTISTDNGSLQLSAAVLPSNATNKAVIWSLVNGTGQASINTSGRVTAIDNGTVTAKASSNDGSGVYGTILITVSNQIVPVTSIAVTGTGGATTITTDKGTLQLSAAVLPSNATNKTVTWSIVNGTGQATINTSGRVTAIDNGIVTARATANDGSGIYGTLVIAISNQIVLQSGIIVTGAGGATIITEDNGSLQLNKEVLPANATNKTVTWSILNGTGVANINATGLVTAVDNGTVKAIATAIDGSGISGNLIITIFNQIVPVTNITVTGAGGTSTITVDNGSLQLSAAILPQRATDNTVQWSIVNGTGRATINAEGVVTALDNGTVTVRATANDGSGIYGTLNITISDQTGPVTGITVTGAGGNATISTDNGTLQLSAKVSPANATVKTVSWSFENSTTLASINSSGLVTALENGTVTSRATARDGSGVFGTLVITITNQVVPVTGINVTGPGETTSITVDKGSLLLNAEVSPLNATDKTVTWSIINGTGQASIDATGNITAITNGTVSAVATANDGSGISGILVISISNQIIPVNRITIRGEGGLTAITTFNGSLQLIADILPLNASYKTVEWSIVNNTGLASITNSGLITAVNDGTLTVRAMANDGSGIFGTLDISISGQEVPVTGIIITGGEGTAITINNRILQLGAAVFPPNATNKTVTWSIVKGIGLAAINSNGLVTAVDKGIVTVKASATDGTGIYDLIDIPIIIDNSDLSSITVTRDEIKIQLNDNYISWKAGLYNLEGSLVLSELVTSDIFVFDISSQPSGMYLVVLSKGVNIKVAKVIKP